METTIRKAKGSDVFKYAVAGISGNTTYFLMLFYLTFFFTDIYGISATTVAGLMAVTRIIDAITDPLMGMLADRTKTKAGRYRPWIMGAAPLLGIAVFLLFSTPNLSPSMKIVYAYVVYISYSLFSTATGVPASSLLAVMTNDSKQRTLIATVKQAMMVPAAFFVSVLALPMVNAFGGGARGWQIYGGICGMIATVCYWISAWGAKRYDTLDVDLESKEKLTIKSQLTSIAKNRPLWMLNIAFSTDQFASAVSTAVNVYFFTYYLGRQDLVAIVSSMQVLACVVSFAVIPVLSRKVEKNKLYMGATVLVMIPYIVMFLLPTNVPVIMAGTFIANVLSTITITMGWAMLPDCVEYGEWKTGIRGSGMVTAAFGFSQKIGMALGGAAVGMMLSAVGYVAGAEQNETALEAIKAMKFIAPVLGYICSIISMRFYGITDSFYKKMLDDINKRKMKTAESK